MNDLHAASAPSAALPLGLRPWRLQGPIEALLRVAVKVLPRACDYAVVFYPNQTHQHPVCPVDVWVASNTLHAKLGRWYITLDFHKDSKKARAAKERARVEQQGGDVAAWIAKEAAGPVRA